MRAVPHGSVGAGETFSAVHAMALRCKIIVAAANVGDHQRLVASEDVAFDEGPVEEDRRRRHADQLVDIEHPGQTPERFGSHDSVGVEERHHVRFGELQGELVADEVG